MSTRPPPRDDAGTAKTRWRKVAGQLRPKVPKLAGPMDESEPDVRACLTFPAAHRVELHSTNPPGASTGRPGAILLEQNDAWAAAAGHPADPPHVA